MGLIGGTAAKLWGKAKSNVVQPIAKEAGNQWSLGVKQPTNAFYQAVKTGNAQPIKDYGGNLWSAAIKQPANKIANNVTGAFNGGGASGPAQPAAAAPTIDYSKYQLKLAPDASAAEGKSYVDLISGPENADAMKASIGQQYGAMSSLAKLREGTQRQTEQDAIARRLAASGMSSSGAGMRLQQQGLQASGRRAAETQLGIAAQQVDAEARAQDAIAGRNLQREQMKVGATQAEADRAFRERQFQYGAENDAKAFAREGEVLAENQRIARETQRYNNQGLFGQLGQDLFGPLARQTSMRTPLGSLGGLFG